MALCGLLALGFGYLLGLRFRIGIVLPVEFVALVALGLLGVTGRVSAADACLGFVVFSFALQAGYALALACPVPMRRAVRRKPLKA